MSRYEPDLVHIFDRNARTGVPSEQSLEVQFERGRYEYEDDIEVVRTDRFTGKVYVTTRGALRRVLLDGDM